MTKVIAPITGETVCADFNHVRAVLHYTKAAHSLGLWRSELVVIERFLTDKSARLLEAGCGAGRVALSLAQLGYAEIVGFDFATELVEQAESLARERAVTNVHFAHADATTLAAQCNLLGDKPRKRTRAATNTCNLIGDKRPEWVRPESFDGVLFMFNGLMQIPGRANRRAALRGLHALARKGAPLIFTTHDRDDEAAERRHWKRQAEIWAAGKQDPALVEFGDRYFVDDDDYRVFMHLPDRAEIVEDLAATGWTLEFDEMRRRLAVELKPVRDFSDECRFWVARK